MDKPLYLSTCLKWSSKDNSPVGHPRYASQHETIFHEKIFSINACLLKGIFFSIKNSSPKDEKTEKHACRLHQHLAYTLWQNKQYPEARQHFLQSSDGEVNRGPENYPLMPITGLWLNAGWVPSDARLQLWAGSLHRSDCPSISLPQEKHCCLHCFPRQYWLRHFIC